MIHHLFRSLPAPSHVLPRQPLPHRLPSPRRQDPVAATRHAALAWLDRLCTAMTGPHGLPPEDLLCALAAVAGHACQAAARAEFVERRGLDERQVFVVIDAHDGRRYYSGEMIQRSLFDEPASVWRLTAGRARQLGGPTGLDLAALVLHVSGTLGTPAFGLPRWPAGHAAAATPMRHLQSWWPVFRRIVAEHDVAPSSWPVAGALALQEAMSRALPAIAPEAALQLVMEVAVPMSRVRLAVDA